MQLQDWANLAEVVGLLLVIATFVYLSRQIKQSSQSMHAQTAQAIHTTFMDGFKMLCSDDELNRVYRQGILHPDNLNEAESGKFFAFMGYFTASMYNAYNHHIHSAVDRDVTSSWLKGYEQIYSTAGFKAFWPQRKFFYSQKFIDYVESSMAGGTLDEPYRPFTTKSDDSDSVPENELQESNA